MCIFVCDTSWSSQLEEVHHLYFGKKFAVPYLNVNCATFAVTSIKHKKNSFMHL